MGKTKVKTRSVGSRSINESFTIDRELGILGTLSLKSYTAFPAHTSRFIETTSVTTKEEVLSKRLHRVVWPKNSCGLAGVE